ncbi:hypothetical protein MMC27_007071 [Xylographa pallens]|nr:hypothetical protein [Xylographa pallens]
MSNKSKDFKGRVIAAFSSPLSALHEKVQRNVSKVRCTGNQVVRAIIPPHLPTLRYWQRRRAISEIPPRISTSRLLALPTEIRQMIFALVLGNRVLQLTYEDRWLRNRIRPGHSCIRNPSAVIKADKTCEAVPYYGLSGWCLDDHGVIYATRKSETFRPLALLRTCRAIYIEAIQMIYSTNAIDLDFWGFAELTYWSASIGPARLASITSLQMHCNVWFDLRNAEASLPFLGVINEFPGFRTWREVWAIVAEEMPSLRALVVRMFMCIRLYPAEERELLRPIAQITGLKHLSVRRVFNKRHQLRSKRIDFESVKTRDFVEETVAC